MPSDRTDTERLDWLTNSLWEGLSASCWPDSNPEERFQIYSRTGKLEFGTSVGATLRAAIDQAMDDIGGDDAD